MSCGCGCNGAPGGCGGHDHAGHMHGTTSYQPIQMGRTRNPALTPRTALIVGALLGIPLGYLLQAKLKIV